MRIQRSIPLTIVALFAAGACVTSDPTGSSSQSLKGAIFTTTKDGSKVNANIYAAKEDVYLDGGPKKEKSAALPDGDYYFQVTDPSGKTLLSSDDIHCRAFHVASGLIDHLVLTGCMAPHNTGIDAGSGGLTVQLMPYDDTPNHGDEYKAWVTPVGDYPSNDPGARHGFSHEDSKTDNFKVRVPRCGDGIKDKGEDCDDGDNNGKDGDECDNECHEKCGNGRVDHDMHEDCDEGDDNGKPGHKCDKDCHEKCGNGHVDDDTGEECDDGDKNGTEGDDCDKDCHHVCHPDSCADHGYVCGSFVDKCGGEHSCGTCPTDDTCVNHVCVPPSCTPKTCADHAGACGDFSDGCGGTLSCGCTGSDQCVAGQCVPPPPTCTPDTCAAHGFNCGFLDDKCGGTVCCGQCTGSDTCVNNVCTPPAPPPPCVPTTCMAQGKNCGSISDGCGGSLDCGTCPTGSTCGGSGIPNVCCSGAPPPV